MGGELSKPVTEPAPAEGMRRVESGSVLVDQMHQRNLQRSNPTSASASALSSMGQNASVTTDTATTKTEGARRNSLSGSSGGSNGSTAPKSTASRLLDSMRRLSGHRAANDSAVNGSVAGSTVGEDQSVESLDLPIVEWEGYVTKRGHLVRNWKSRFFTLEGNNLSYYETKADARNRDHLKGRVNVASVKIEKVSKSGHGYDFTFETTEGKVFHCGATTEMEQLAWVYFLEAGIDCSAMKKNNKPIYNTYRHGRLPDMRTEAAYDVYRRLLCGDLSLTSEFLSYFNKDMVFTSTYPKHTPFHGDFFGREGFLHFICSFHHNVELVEFTVSDIAYDANGKSITLKGSEKLKSKFNGQVVTQPWTHHVQFGPYGRIVKLKVVVDSLQAATSWKAFGVKNPFSEASDAAMRSTRSLSISLKDFTVYNVIGKGGFGTVINAVKKSDGQIYALKILEKSKMTKYDIESSFTEMRVAQNIHHPFIAGLRIAFQSRTKLFLGMNYYGGGDLFHHMSKGSSCRIAADRAHFYTAELVLGIHHLHQHDILYRDIKPENVMIDGEGHIALVDFGLAKLHVSNYKGAKTMAGSPQYTAPELLLPKAKRSYGKAADWWSLGILLYEMSVGKSPFYDSNIEKMYHKIQTDPLTFPDKPVLPEPLKDILIAFLQKDPTLRLGSNISDILNHEYFEGIDWDLLLQKKIEAPWKPKLASPLDVEYVDQEFTDMDAYREVQSPTDKSSRSKGFLSLGRGGRKTETPAQDPTFKDFTYYCEDPDALVEVTNLVHELHPTPPPPPPPTDSYNDLSVTIPDPTGTPLSSFVENGKLDAVALARSPGHVRKSLEQLEYELAQQFARLEVTISRERPAHLQQNKTEDAPPATPSEETDAEAEVEVVRRKDGASQSSSSSSSYSTHDPSLVI
ncbi:hypothetical protein Poli38472_000907 [Pythium oligandrum]|uniref:AGC/AKT protein kinase n=1 Tax=Pythium oligandrum TaxID=41045 RepID=A0A8K1CCZ6_PYTOL|nr:hypothetical protein Poli38472_000907 [Pythium oligandrum]|eukprot:TMW60865.1 hypothetical protein Poli38472_000907 [Pythium oligandrum]